MYTVLVPVKTEASLGAIDYVEALPSGDEGVEVVLLNVFEEFKAADEAGVVRSADLYDETDLPEPVVEAARELEDCGIDVSVRREHGDPAEEIVRVAREIDADTIAMAGRKRSAAGKMLFGSVTQSVLLEADRPVTVLRR